MTQNQNDPLTFLDDTYQEHKVLGKPVKFYPVDIALLLELRIIAQPFAEAVTVLLGGNVNDTGTINRELSADAEMVNALREEVRDIGDGERRAAVFFQLLSAAKDKEIIIEALKPEMADRRIAQKQSAISKLIATVMSDEALRVVSKIVYESVKKGFWPDGNYASLEDFTVRVTAPSLYDFAVGVAITNKGILGPLASVLGGPEMEMVKQALKRRVAQVGQSENAEQKESASQQATGPVAG